MSVEQRPLGNSGLSTAPIVFGGNVFGWTIDQDQSFRLLDQFVEAGFNTIDTADMYSRWVPGNQGGESETIIGNWLKHSGKRNQVVIATKVGMEMGPGEKGLSKDYIFQSVQRSLKRLQTDVIDLYQAHEDDPNTPLEETLGAFDQLVQQGKVRAIGASNYTGERLKAALQVSKENGFVRYETLQPHYNLYDRHDFEADLMNTCEVAGIGVIPYYSLASGFLTGKYRSEADFSKSARGQGMARFLDDRGHRILAALDKLSAELNSTPATIALAWLLSRPSISAPIASATSPEQLTQLLKVTDIQLDTAALDLLYKASNLN